MEDMLNVGGSSEPRNSLEIIVGSPLDIHIVACRAHGIVVSPRLEMGNRHTIDNDTREVGIVARFGLYQHTVIAHFSVLGSNCQIGIASQAPGSYLHLLCLIANDIAQRGHLWFRTFHRRRGQCDGVLLRSRVETGYLTIIQQDRCQLTIR